MGIWTIRVGACLSELILNLISDAYSYTITTGALCDPSSYSSLGIGRGSLLPLRMVPWGKYIPNSRLCTSTFIGFPTFNQLTLHSFGQAEAKATRLIILVLAAIHFGIALSFKVLFFSYYVVDKIGADITIPGVPTDGNATIPRWT